MHTVLNQIKSSVIFSRLNKQKTFLAGLLLILIVYGFKLLNNPSGLHWGDADFFFAMSEAFRNTVLEYRQFPWLNPWIAGDVPLYADPQFGLFSIQSAFVLIFGSVIGWKIALIFYLALGYIGVYILCRRVFKTNYYLAILLALTWTFALIWTQRSTGHLSFFNFSFLPWALYLLWYRDGIKYASIKLGAILALAVNSAPHNTTIMMLSVVYAALLFEIFSTKRKQLKQIFKFALISSGIMLLLSAHKLYFTFVYSRESSVVRNIDPEEYPGFNNVYNAIFSSEITQGLLPSGWGKGEALVGIGPGVGIVIALILTLVTVVLLKHKSSTLKYTARKISKLFQGPIFFVSFSLILALSLSLGDFFNYSPYTFLRELPIFENTRVAVRWLLVASFFFLLFIGSYRFSKNQLKIVCAILSINLMLLIQTVIVAPNLYVLSNPKSDVTLSSETPPTQIIQWNSPRSTGNVYDDNLYLATKNNIDQISTNLVPFFDTKYGKSARCSEATNIECTFVISKNAELVHWSPNKIVLQRTGDGDIELNMNPSRYWFMNDNEYIFANKKVVDPTAKFTINTDQNYILLEYSPPLTYDWLRTKL